MIHVVIVWRMHKTWDDVTRKSNNCELFEKKQRPTVGQ